MDVQTQRTGGATEIVNSISAMAGNAGTSLVPNHIQKAVLGIDLSGFSKL